MEIKARILVVDDNCDLCENIKDVLEENDYLAECAVNGKEAIELARNNKYDIALIDIKLPDISGNEVVEKIAEISPSTDFIYMTAHATINSAIEAVKQEHAVSYETKPLDMDRLLSTIKQICKRRETEKALKVSEKKTLLLLNSTGEAIYGLDLEGNCTFCNPSCLCLLGYEDESQLLGRNMHALIHHTKKDGTPYLEDECCIYQAFREGKGTHVDDEVLWRADCTSFASEYRSFPIFHEGETVGAVVSFVDITERKQAEEQIKASLKEKEVLLREIHHRVKNNMQVMASLLRLQSEGIKDKHLLDLFNESRNRIKSMALIHEDLYSGKDLARIDFEEYTRTLTGRLMKSFGVDPNRIITSVNIEGVFLGVDKAIPCGLILNELFTNSMKYAFPHIKTDVEHIPGKDEDRERSKNKGEVRIDCHSNSDEYTLVFSDNGVGLPEDIDFQKTETLGLDLVVTLVKQLKGTIELNRSGGTEFKITFSL